MVYSLEKHAPVWAENAGKGDQGGRGQLALEELF